MTQKQKAIVQYLMTGQKTKSQIVNRFKSWHYHNSNKHIGGILSRMVKAGQIVRIKKGVYCINEEPVHKAKKEIDTNQQSLF